MKKAPLQTAGLALLVLLAGSCASNPGPPGPGEARGSVPDLRGQRVLVLPVQIREGVPPEVTVDEELAFALRNRGREVLWAFPPDVEGALRRSPGLPARLRDLPVGIFLQVEVERVGDPLYGDIRRVAALTGADVAILPIQLRYHEEGVYRITAAVLSVRTGRVAWFGVIQGGKGGAGEAATLASMAEALALALLPLG